MYVDLIFVLFVFFFSIIGFFHGLINQLFSLLAIIVCLIWGQSLFQFVEAHTQTPWPKSIGFMIVLMTVYFLVVGIGFLVDKLVKSRAPIQGSWNPILGSVLGGIKACFVGVIVLHVLSFIPSQLFERTPALHNDYKKSTIANFVNSHELFDVVLNQLDPLLSSGPSLKKAGSFTIERAFRIDPKQLDSSNDGEPQSAPEPEPDLMPTKDVQKTPDKNNPQVKSPDAYRVRVLDEDAP